MNPSSALITGVSGSIGAATAQALDRRGWRVFGTYLNHPERVPSACVSHRIDFTRPSRAARRLKGKLEPVVDRLDLLVHAAGFVRDGLVVRMNHEQWRQVRRVHLDAAYYLSRRLKPLLSRGDGPSHVVFLTSKAGIEGTAGQGNYAAAKAGLIGLMASLAREWAPGILVNALRPPLTRSSTTQTLSPDRLSKRLGETLTGDWAPPRQTAEAVVLISNQTALTGQLIPVDNRFRSPWS